MRQEKAFPNIIRSLTGAIALLCGIILISCEEGPTPINFQDGFHRISSIEYFSNHKPEGSEIFSYQDSVLHQVDDMRWNRSYKEFVYDDQNRLLEIDTYQTDDDLLTAKDSIIYDDNSRIIKIYFFRKKTDPEIALSWTDDFLYNSDGYLKEKIQTFGTDPDNRRSRRYYWKNNNIIQVDDLDTDGNLRHEWFYEYDNKFNYQLNNPNFITFTTLSWSKNNIIRTSARDYTGLLDLACNPCDTKYFYNRSGLPTNVFYQWSRALDISYL